MAAELDLWINASFFFYLAVGKPEAFSCFFTWDVEFYRQIRFESSNMTHGLCWRSIEPPEEDISAKNKVFPGCDHANLHYYSEILPAKTQF